MQLIEVPEFPRLRGEEAIAALSNFVGELEKQRDKELTDEQTTVLTKFAKGLISSIKTEKRFNTSDKADKQTGFVSQFKKTIIKYISESFRFHEKGRLWK